MKLISQVPVSAILAYCLELGREHQILVPEMLDPLTAVSLASAIVQFVDSSSKLVRVSLKLYALDEGSSKQNLDLEHAIAGINELNKKLLPDRTGSNLEPL